MAFAAPLLLAGLALLAIPLLIHLFQFRRFKTIYFSNVALLRQLMQQTNSPRRWKHFIILASRLLAFLFLVLAFARPYWPGVSMGLALLGLGLASKIFFDAF